MEENELKKIDLLLERAVFGIESIAYSLQELLVMFSNDSPGNYDLPGDFTDVSIKVANDERND